MWLFYLLKYLSYHEPIDRFSNLVNYFFNIFSFYHLVDCNSRAKISKVIISVN